MTALTARDIDSFIAKPDPNRPIVLIFGADTGLVRERSDAVIAASVDDVNDPFSVVRIEGDDLAADPARLVDEAMTVPMFGGRRAIRVRAGSRSFISAVEILTAEPPQDCRIVIEAGELRRDAPLRSLCEKAKTAAAIACYPDTARDLDRLIDTELNAARLRISPDARSALAMLLGGDRQGSRNELRKLALYAHGKSEVTVDDIAAVVTDASGALQIDPIVDAAFAGKAVDVENNFLRAVSAGLYPAVIISAAQRQAALLHKARIAVDDGEADPGRALESGFPRLHFSRKASIELALRNWTGARLLAVMIQLADAAFAMRQQAAISATIAQRVLMAIAVNARRRG
jgi:DNA polymerase-3 subunit delta